jgi:hypothetical protein
MFQFEFHGVLLKFAVREPEFEVSLREPLLSCSTLFDPLAKVKNPRNAAPLQATDSIAICFMPAPG